MKWCDFNGKRIYTRGEARVAAEIADVDLRVYLDKNCNHWHLTSQRLRKRSFRILRRV